MSDIAQMVKITLNGKEQEIKAGLSVSDLLVKWRMRPELVTVEINETILQKLDYDSTVIQAGDKVEFIFYMGGGSETMSNHKVSATVLDLIGNTPMVRLSKVVEKNFATVFAKLEMFNPGGV